MGQVVAVLTVITAAASAIASIVRSFTSEPVRPNLVLEEIQRQTQPPPRRSYSPPDPAPSRSPPPRVGSTSYTYSSSYSPSYMPPPDPNAQVKSQWKKSMHPRVWPTTQEYERAVAMTRDPAGQYLHFGVSGTVKSGKSSLINSLRGIGPRHHMAARVGVTECTRDITRYEDPRAGHPFAWYGIPGSGTAKCPAQTYFNAQGLFALDCIIVLIQDSFTEADSQLIRQCDDLCIPTYVVRSKSDVAIRNIMDDEDIEQQPAKLSYIKSVSDNVRQGLTDFSLGDKRVYLRVINKADMLAASVGKKPSDMTIHEEELLLDALKVCKERRLIPGNGAASTSG